MVAVPILARSGDTIGVIVLHTRAPHEFTEDAVKLLVHIASLVSGAIENAQLYDRERRRVDSLTELSGLAQEVAAASDAAELGPAVTKGTRRLLGAEVCQLYRLDRDGTGLRLLASSPDGASAPLESVRGGAAAGGARRSRRAARADAMARAGRRRPAGDAAVGGRRTRRAAVRGLAAGPIVRRRGHRDRSGRRPSQRRRDQARRADRGAHQREHRQGPVRGACRGGERVRRRQGRRGPLRSDAPRT